MRFQIDSFEPRADGSVVALISVHISSTLADGGTRAPPRRAGATPGCEPRAAVKNRVGELLPKL